MAISTRTAKVIAAKFGRTISARASLLLRASSRSPAETRDVAPAEKRDFKTSRTSVFLYLFSNFQPGTPGEIGSLDATTRGGTRDTGRFTILYVPGPVAYGGARGARVLSRDRDRGEEGKASNPCHRKTRLEIEFSGHRMTI